MPRIYVLIVTFSISLLICSCSKKHHPGRTSSETFEKNNNLSEAKSNDSIITKKVAIKPKRNDITPKVILVNDNVARNLFLST